MAWRGFGVPVLDALRFVEHDHVGPQALVDIQRVAHHLLVIDDREERRVLAVAAQPGEAPAEDELISPAW